MERDIRFARQVRNQAEPVGLISTRIDGSRSIQSVTAQVQAHFGLG